MTNREIDICEDIIQTSLLLRIALAQLTHYEATDLCLDEIRTRVKITAFWDKLERLQDAHRLYCLGLEIKDNQN